MLEASNKEVLCLRSGAFYFMYFGEETEDPQDLSEIAKISERYKHGFEIEEYQPIDGIPYVEAIIIPYRPATFLPTHEKEIMKGVKLQIKYTDNNTLQYRFVKDLIPLDEVATAPIEINQFSKPQFTTKLGSVFPLWKIPKIK